ncbi:hypothetical protein [Nibribacter koreensis]|uniref:Uncharacterized protein n=1 Tax=Nibribacter koreensis TaxID=1084519 RepID=A0ABP8FB90_9BACT
METSNIILKIWDEAHSTLLEDYRKKRDELNDKIAYMESITPAQMMETVLYNLPPEPVPVPFNGGKILPKKVIFLLLQERNKLTDRDTFVEEFRRRGGKGGIGASLHRQVSVGHLIAFETGGGTRYNQNNPLYGLPEWFNEDGTPKPEYLP